MSQYSFTKDILGARPAMPTLARTKMLVMMLNLMLALDMSLKPALEDEELEVCGDCIDCDEVVCGC
jgi:hypothetical protein